MLNSQQLGEYATFGAEKAPRLSLAEKEANARCWTEQYPQKASDLVAELLHYVSAAPIHSALLGPIAERYGAPKPISAIIRLYPQFRILTGAASPVNSPALCLSEKIADPDYWARFRRKSAEGFSSSVDMNPWVELGVPDVGRGFGEVRVQIFASFLTAKYGVAVMKDLAAVCSAFKRASGFSFQAFFGGMRPADFQRDLLAGRYFTWSWTNDTPPCLYCSVRRAPFGMECNSAPGVDPELVRNLLPLVGKYPPENIDFEGFSIRHQTSLVSVHVSYLAALRQALLQKSDSRATAQMLPRLDRELARELYSEARRGLAIFAGIISKIEKYFPDLAK